MKLGRSFLHQLPRPWAEDSEYDTLPKNPEHAQVIDQCGYGYLRPTERHFLEGYSHSAAPEIFPAAREIKSKFFLRSSPKGRT
jgi:hypothetical protein